MVLIKRRRNQQLRLGFGSSVSHSMEGKIRSGNTWCSSPAKRPTRASATGIGRGRRRQRTALRERGARREGFFFSFLSFFFLKRARVVKWKDAACGCSPVRAHGPSGPFVANFCCNLLLVFFRISFFSKLFYYLLFFLILYLSSPQAVAEPETKHRGGQFTN